MKNENIKKYNEVVFHKYVVVHLKFFGGIANLNKQYGTPKWANLKKSTFLILTVYSNKKKENFIHNGA